MHMCTKLEGITKMLREFFPGEAKWTPEDMPNLTGKVIIVTGGNTGIGYQTAQALLFKNATVYIGARSISKAEAAVQSLSEATGNSKIFILQMDLADLPSVKKAADEFQSKEQKLHVLINNAGVMSVPKELLTAQGYDLQFGTNVLGHYLFSRLLIPLMEATAATVPATDPVRLVEVTSDGHLMNPNKGEGLINYDTLRSSVARDGTGSISLYFQSKSGNILVSKARARLLEGKNIVTMSVHPGHIKSEITRHSLAYNNPIWGMLQYPTPMGAITQLYAATSTEAAQLNGKYLAPWVRVKEPRSDHIDNIIVEDKLIAWLEEQLRVNNVL